MLTRSTGVEPSESSYLGVLRKFERGPTYRERPSSKAHHAGPSMQEDRDNTEWRSEVPNEIGRAHV